MPTIACLYRVYNKMKYFITIALTVALIQLTNCLEDYGDDAGLFSYDAVLDKIDDTPKPTYNIQDAPKLFEKYIKDFSKKYKDENDKKKHYESFLENLKEINSINSDKEFSSTVDINLFTDYSKEERQQLLGVA